MANAIGTAYVQILPSTQGIASGIGGALAGGAAASAASAAGSTLGGVLGGTLGGTLGKLFPKLLPLFAATGIVSFGKAAVQTGMQFDASMSQVYALMTSVNDGAGLTEAQMVTLSDRAREMGSTTQFTAQEVADAMSYMALAGWDVGQIYSGIPDVLNLAAASGMDLGRASDIVTDYMSAFSYSAPSASHLVDLLAYAQANSNATTEQFAQAWKYSGGMMNTFGQTADTTTAILARLADQGHKASTGGTELNAVMTSLYKGMDKNGDINFAGQIIHLADATENFDPAEYAAALSQLNSELEGLDPASAEYAQKITAFQEQWGDVGKFRNIIEVFTEMQQVLSGQGLTAGTPGYIAALSGLFGNVRAMRGIAAILNGDTSAMKEFEDALGNSEGEADKQRKKRNDNLAGDLKLLASATDELKIQVSNVLTPILRTVVQGLTAIVTWMNGRSDNPLETFAGENPGNISETDAEKVGQRAQQLMNELKFGELTPEQRESYINELRGMVDSIERLPLDESGQNAIAGIANGMTDYNFEGDAETVKNNIISTIDNALEAHSPAQALVPTGQNAAQGIMQGMSQYDYTAEAMLITQAIQTAITTNFTTADWSLASQATAAGIGAGIQAKLPLVESAAAQMVNATVNKVAGLVGAGGSTFKKFGYDIAAGIAAGIDEGSDLISDAISGAIKAGLDDAKDDAGVGSPSRLFADELGRWIPAGVAKGITDNSGVIGSALSDSMSDAAQWNGMAFPAGAAQGGFVQNVTVNSPTALSPWEVARQTRNATRRMALALRR